MSRKRLLTIIFTIICLLAILLFVYSFTYQMPHDSETPPQDVGDGISPKTETSTQPNTNGGTTNDGNLFVIPESPVGTLGLVSAVAIAFGLFALLKKRENKP